MVDSTFRALCTCVLIVAVDRVRVIDRADYFSPLSGPQTLNPGRIDGVSASGRRRDDLEVI